MTPLQLRTAIAKRAGELSKVGMRRYKAENRLLLHPSIVDSHSSAMDRIRSVTELRQELVKDLMKVRVEFEKMAALPIEEWIDG